MSSIRSTSNLIRPARSKAKANGALRIDTVTSVDAQDGLHYLEFASQPAVICVASYTPEVGDRAVWFITPGGKPVALGSAASPATHAGSVDMTGISSTSVDYPAPFRSSAAPVSVVGTHSAGIVIVNVGIFSSTFTILDPVDGTALTGGTLYWQAHWVE